MCSSTIISLDRIDYWVACECKWDNSGDTTAVLKHWARALCRMSSYSSTVTCDVRSFTHSACMPCIKAVIAQSDRHIATAFCSLTVIPSNQSCTVRCHVHSYHPQLRTSGSASYPRATCTTHKHQHSIAHIKQQLIHQQHHIICHSCHPMPPTALHTHQHLHTSGCAS